MINAVNIPIYKYLIEDAEATDFEVPTSLGEYVSQIVGLLVIIAAIALFIYLVWGGIKWLTAGSDSQKVDDARSHLTNAVIGMVIVACAWAVFAFIDYFLGLNVAEVSSPPPTGGGCFTANTQILMLDGSYKPISSIQSGDEIYSFDLTSHQLVSNTVDYLQIHSNAPFDLLTINQDLEVTPVHLMWVVNHSDWIPAGKLQTGDVLLNNQGEPEVISTIDHSTTTSPVYNLHLIEQNHNYFAQNYLVHNIKTP